MSDAFVVVHVATTCDEHGVYVTKDSAEVIEMAWIMLNAKTLEEVCICLMWRLGGGYGSSSASINCNYFVNKTARGDL
ncbi:hypothetical protein V1517DRAFT_317489 [Lipomyces orientalis]|uniref:Uncharacterized protein n=1 Tax=Lipomyces orientalis TaxID=1233043 RepID=A0ACC3TTR1_9ASCO